MAQSMDYGSHPCLAKVPVIVCLLFLSFLITVSSSAGTMVHQVNKRSLEKFLNGKYFTLTYVDATSCSRCRNLYPFFVAAAQAFPNDPEIFFSRTYDKELIKEWQVDELPALVYHREGSNQPGILNVDVTVDDIIDEIARLLHGDFTSVERRYTVSLNPNNYDELVITPKQSVMILIHNEHTFDTLEMMEKVAYSFRKDDGILFATIDVKTDEALRNERFRTRDVPSIMWLSNKEKSTPKRFGGVHKRHLMVQFINEQTGLNRNAEGGMKPESGRIPYIDELLTEYADVIHDVDSDKLALLTLEINKHRDTIEDHMLGMLEYYAFVLDHLAMSGSVSVFNELSRGIENRLYEDDDLNTKTTESLKRHKNIVSFFQELMSRYARGQWTRKQESRSLFGEEAEVVTVHTTGHVHTEL